MWTLHKTCHTYTLKYSKSCHRQTSLRSKSYHRRNLYCTAKLVTHRHTTVHTEIFHMETIFYMVGFIHAKHLWFSKVNVSVYFTPNDRRDQDDSKTQIFINFPLLQVRRRICATSAASRLTAPANCPATSSSTWARNLTCAPSAV